MTAVDVYADGRKGYDCTVHMAEEVKVRLP